jgi:hypothetical protein
MSTHIYIYEDTYIVVPVADTYSGGGVPEIACLPCAFVCVSVRLFLDSERSEACGVCGCVAKARPLLNELYCSMACK